VPILASFAQVPLVRKGVSRVIVYQFMGFAKPDFETIRDPLCVRVFQLWLPETLTLLASLVPDDSVVSFAAVKSYGEGNHLARPGAFPTRFVGTGKVAHDVCVVVSSAIIEAASFEELHGKHWLDQFQNLFMLGRL
jgi:hypothetical protein